MAGATVVDGSGDTSVDDLMRGVLANATVASTFASPRFSYTPVGDDRGARCPADGFRGRVWASGPPGHKLKLHLNMPGAPGCACSSLLLQRVVQSRGTVALCTVDSLFCCGGLSCRGKKLCCPMAGLDNLINNNYDYAITAMAVPAASSAALAPGYADARVALPCLLRFSPYVKGHALPGGLRSAACIAAFALRHLDFKSSCAVCEHSQLVDCLLCAFLLC